MTTFRSQDTTEIVKRFLVVDGWKNRDLESLLAFQFMNLLALSIL